jgi:hypothetical protein
MITLAGQAKERGSAGITVVITDSAGVAVTPTALTYTLTAEDGTVINGRSAAAVSPLAESMLIVLHGDDLQVLSRESGRRYVPRLLALTGTYGDSLLGADSPYTEQVRFVVESIIGIS